jgi:hypothetical protein
MSDVIYTRSAISVFSHFPMCLKNSSFKIVWKRIATRMSSSCPKEMLENLKSFFEKFLKMICG